MSNQKSLVEEFKEAGFEDKVKCIMSGVAVLQLAQYYSLPSYVVGS